MVIICMTSLCLDLAHICIGFIYYTHEEFNSSSCKATLEHVL